MVDQLHRILLNPFRVLLICVIFVCLAITWDGSLFQYWSLTQTEKELDTRILKVVKDSGQLKSRIEQTKSLNFLERQARDSLDLVGEDEIVFVFSDEL